MPMHFKRGRTFREHFFAHSQGGTALQPSAEWREGSPLDAAPQQKGKTARFFTVKDDDCASPAPLLWLFRFRYLTVLFLFFACATQSGKSAPFAYLTNSAQFFLLPPSEIESPLDMAQTVAAVFNGEEYFFASWTRADESILDIALFSEFGADAGRLVFDGETISFASAFAPANFKPEYLAADFELCFFKPAPLAAALKKAKLDFVVETSGGAEIRTIYDGKKLVVEIEKTNGQAKLKNHLRGYEIVIDWNLAEKAALE